MKQVWVKPKPGLKIAIPYSGLRPKHLKEGKWTKVNDDPYWRRRVKDGGIELSTTPPATMPPVANRPAPAVNKPAPTVNEKPKKEGDK